MKKIHTNWLLYDPIQPKNKENTKNEQQLSEEIKYKIKLIEKAFH